MTPRQQPRTTETRRCDDDPGKADDEADEAPFEWLTSFRSLRHLVAPSRLAGADPGSAREDAATAAATERAPTATMCLSALHLGCGTSAAGEALLGLRERTRGGLLRYGHVLNVDNDREALRRMRTRWERRRRAHDDHISQQSDEIGRMEWRYLDFKSEETCRAALDGAGIPVGGFDLVFDKSTLDCLLCSETCVAAQFLHEAYRALRVPASKDATSHENPEAGRGVGGAGAARSSSWGGSSWGGVYVVVTFHPVEFVERLLTALPGADWRVEHEVIRRELEDVEEDRLWTVEEATTPSHDVDADANAATRDVLPPAASAWSSGTFSPDENYRRTVTVFTCRRCCTANDKSADAMQSSRVLDREEVRQHVERTCDEWYRRTNPMVTSAREARLRAAFAAAATSAEPGQARDDRPVPKEDGALELPRCYELMFTEEEREHLAYEYFLEDWAAYRDLKGEDGTPPPGAMTVGVALDFLREMQ